MAMGLRRTAKQRFILRLERLESRLTPAFMTFRAGTSGISVQDTVISASEPSAAYPSAQTITVAGDNSTNGKRQALMRFDNLFGSAPNQVPLGANVTSASLTLWAAGASHNAVNIEFHRMLQGWVDVTSTWDSFGQGVQFDGSEAAATVTGLGNMTSMGTNFSGRQILTDVQAWQSGNASAGWVISTPLSNAAWSFASSEDLNITHRPTLTIEYLPVGYSNPSYVDLAGLPPESTKLAWFDWSDSLRDIRLARIPNARTNTYYFAQNGDDFLGWGTIDHPWKTLAKAQQVLEATAGDVRLRFRRGDVWHETTTLAVERDNITVDDYGDTNLAKPTFSRFIPLNSASWTLVQGNLYKYTAPPAVGWIREATDGFTNLYYRAGSSSEVAGRIYSWFYDSAGSDPANNYQPALYVNAGSNPALLSGGLEYCPDNGIGWSVFADNVRLQNLRIEGVGIASNGVGHGLIIPQINYWEFVGVGLEIYYTGYHSISQIVRSQGGHGVVTLVDTSAGLCVNRNGNGDPGSGDMSVFVAYGDYGGNEYIQYRCTMAYGTLPSSDWQAVPGMRHGEGMLSHVGPAGSLDLVIVTGTAALPTVNPLASLNHVDSMPTANSLNQIRGFIVEDKTGPVESVIYNPNVAVINCVIDRTTPQYYPSSVANYYWPYSIASWLINCTMTIDLSLQPSQTGQFYYLVAGIDSSRYINCQIDMFNATTDLFFRDPNHPNIPTSIYAAPTVFTNTIFSFDTTKKSGLGLMNTPTNLRNNAYYLPRRESPANWNYDNDLGAVTLSARYPAGTAPSPSSPLYNGGLDVGLEYDQKRKPRGKLHGIGPLVGSRLPTPTQITYAWGIRTANLINSSTLPFSTINRFALQFPNAVDVRQKSLSIRGPSGVVESASMAYDPYTFSATWQLVAPLAAGKYTMELDGLVISTFNVLPGDLDGTYYVDQADYQAFRLLYGSNDGRGDIDGNGIVAQSDFDQLRAHYNIFV